MAEWYLGLLVPIPRPLFCELKYFAMRGNLRFDFLPPLPRDHTSFYTSTVPNTNWAVLVVPPLISVGFHLLSSCLVSFSDWVLAFVFPDNLSRPFSPYPFSCGLLCLDGPTLHSSSSRFVSWLCSSISIFFACLSAISCVLAKSKASWRVWGLLSKRRQTLFDSPLLNQWHLYFDIKSISRQWLPWRPNYRALYVIEALQRSI